MTIDERLAILTKVQESHDAEISRLVDLHAELAFAQKRTESILATVLENMNRLVGIISADEHRITDLEGGSA